MKKFICLFVLLVVVSHGMRAWEIDGVDYDFIWGSHAVVVGVTSEAPSDLVIPSVIQHPEFGDVLPVTEIGHMAISWSGRSVIIPEDIICQEGWPLGKCPNIEFCKLPSTVNSIPDFAFQDTPIQRLVISGNIKSVGYNAFANCYNLTELVLPDCVSSIGENAFYNTGLKIFEIPKNTERIGSNAFSMSGLENVTLPENVHELGDFVFAECADLKKITLSENITTIPDNTFWNCKSLEEIIIPSKINTVGISAFENCIKLKEIELPSTLTRVEKNAFNNCESLISVDMPDGLEFIGIHAYSGCKNITDINFSRNLREIGDWAFVDCYSLSKIQLPNTLVNIGDGAFCNCKNITEVSLSNSLTRLNQSTFYGCEKLEIVRIPESVTEIAGHVFSYCTNLREVTLPASITSLGSLSFSCPNLEKIRSLSINPPKCDNNAFSGVDKKKCQVYVPRESIDFYKVASVWKEFFCYEDVESGIEDIVFDLSTNVDIYDLNGRMIRANVKNEDVSSVLEPGIYILRLHDGKSRKIYIR